MLLCLVVAEARAGDHHKEPISRARSVAVAALEAEVDRSARESDGNLLALV